MKHRLRVAFLAALALTGLMAADAGAAKKRASGEKLTVMTRNIYLGGDIAGPVGARDRADFEQRATALWQTVLKTNFPRRAKLLAAEIKRSKADVIGLQEVALWRRSPAGVRDGSATPSMQVEQDFLKILQAELRRAKVRYRVGASQTEADIEVPTSEGFDRRLTMRDVVLVKRRKGLKVRKKGGKNFKTRISLATQGGQFTVLRGYSYTDLAVGKKRMRFVNTHLESFLEQQRTAQARELVARRGPVRGTRLPLVLVGDLNSDPYGDSSDFNAFRAVTAAGLKSAWQKLYGRKKANTCCLETPDMADTTAKGFDHHIDHIMYRGKIRPLKETRVGNTLRSRDASTGLWPSDHGGAYTSILLR